MTTRQIATNQSIVACDVCGRTLLRGEEPAVFLAGGARRQVCELCTPRAAHEGWIREGVGDEGLGVPRRRERGGSFFGRLRGRRNGHGRKAPAETELAGAPLEAAAEPEPAPPPPPPPPPARPPVRDPEPELPREPRHIHAVPTNADMKRARAVDVF